MDNENYNLYNSLKLKWFKYIDRQNFNIRYIHIIFCIKDNIKNFISNVEY